MWVTGMHDRTWVRTEIWRTAELLTFCCITVLALWLFFFSSVPPNFKIGSGVWWLCTLVWVLLVRCAVQCGFLMIALEKAPLAVSVFGLLPLDSVATTTRGAAATWCQGQAVLTYFAGKAGCYPMHPSGITATLQATGCRGLWMTGIGRCLSRRGVESQCSSIVGGRLLYAEGWPSWRW
jgi:hypothetical protein